MVAITVKRIVTADVAGPLSSAMLRGDHIFTTVKTIRPRNWMVGVGGGTRNLKIEDMNSHIVHRQDAENGLISRVK